MSKFLAHRLAWLYVYGEWPDELDHINRIRSDNRIANLRVCTTVQNSANSPVKPNISGFPGVFRHNGGWVARIRVNGRRMYLGKFDNPSDASLAYERKARELHGEFYQRAA